MPSAAALLRSGLLAFITIVQLADAHNVYGRRGRRGISWQDVQTKDDDLDDDDDGSLGPANRQMDRLLSRMQEERRLQQLGDVDAAFPFMPRKSTVGQVDATQNHTASENNVTEVTIPTKKPTPTKIEILRCEADNVPSFSAQTTGRATLTSHTTIKLTSTRAATPTSMPPTSKLVAVETTTHSTTKTANTTKDSGRFVLGRGVELSKQSVYFDDIERSGKNKCRLHLWIIGLLCLVVIALLILHLKAKAPPRPRPFDMSSTPPTPPPDIHQLDG